MSGGANEAGADKPHEATPKRMEEARRKGDTPQSRELISLASLAGIAIVATSLGASGTVAVAERLVPFWDRLDVVVLREGSAAHLVKELRGVGSALAPSLAVLGALGLLAAGAQGMRVAPKRIAPDPSRLSPAKGLSRLFGASGWVEFAKSTLKIAGIGALAAWATWGHVPALLALVHAPADAALGALQARLGGAARLVAATLAPIAMLDLLWTRHRWHHRLRMTDQQMREETKGAEGDPVSKGRRASLRRERARRSMIGAVDGASFVVANPTHVAVAMRYDPARDAAPVVVAKGRDHVALRIRERAERAGVPVFEDRPLARALEAAVRCDQTIPEEFFSAVAAIVRHLERVTP